MKFKEGVEYKQYMEVEYHENEVDESETETCMQPKRSYLGSPCEWLDIGNDKHSFDYIPPRFFYGKACFIIFVVWNIGDDGVQSPL